VYDGNVFPIFCQPLADVDTKFSYEFYAWRVMVIKRKPLDAAAKPRWIVCSLWTPTSKHIIVSWMLQFNVYRGCLGTGPRFGHVAKTVPSVWKDKEYMWAHATFPKAVWPCGPISAMWPKLLHCSGKMNNVSKHTQDLVWGYAQYKESLKLIT